MGRPFHIPPERGGPNPAHRPVRLSAYVPRLVSVLRAKYFLNGITSPGLLILRITLAAELSNDALARAHWGLSLSFWPAIGEFMLSALLLLGLLTVFVATLTVAVQLAFVAVLYRPVELSLVLAGMSLSLAWLGPGAWSIDARLFGLRRVEIKNIRDC
jgi:putative oxidoreductase